MIFLFCQRAVFKANTNFSVIYRLGAKTCEPLITQAKMINTLDFIPTMLYNINRSPL